MPKKPKTGIWILVLVIIILSAGFAYAQSTVCSRTGNDVRITTASGDSKKPSLVWTGSEYGVAWDDGRDGTGEIYFTRIDSDGNEIGDDVRITNIGSSMYPSLAYNGVDNEYGVAWHYRITSILYEIYFARIDADGKIGTDERITNTADWEDSMYPSLVWTGSEYGVAWHDDRDNPIGAMYEIYFTKIDADGNEIGDDVRITTATLDSKKPSLVWTGSEYGVAWHDGRDGGGDYEIYFTRIDADGNEIGDDVRITNIGLSMYPSLAYNGVDNEYGVAWRRLVASGNYEIYFARIDASGKIGGNVRITAASGWSVSPSLVWTGSEYGVAWQDNRDGDYEIYFTRIDADGNEIGDDVRITTASGDSENPSLVWIGSEYSIAWQDDREGNDEIYFAGIACCGDAKCAVGETCDADSCCNGVIKDLQTDPNNCGSCGIVCGAGETCVAGVCTPSVVTTECNDGTDNDGDTSIDFPADPGCTDANDNNELDQCKDGEDNDGNGCADYPTDSGCYGLEDTSEADGICPVSVSEASLADFIICHGLACAAFMACGNGVIEAGEECDDGNLIDNDGCSHLCEFEIIDPPCPVGTTLCADNTCSLNCCFTDECTNCDFPPDGTCNAYEGCTCADCDGDDDTCAAGLECSLIPGACCNPVSDGVCDIYCAQTDPDCVGLCGDGSLDFGEQCDDGNLIDNDGCSHLCEFESLDPPCPVGTTLCADNTCSLNCCFTDECTNCDFPPDGTCNNYEGCTCADCDGDVDTCVPGLLCNIIPGACCNPVSDGICDIYCAQVDPDCAPGICGNWKLNPGEECDDGNIFDSDGCSNRCTRESIFGVYEPDPTTTLPGSRLTTFTIEVPGITVEPGQTLTCTIKRSDDSTFTKDGNLGEETVSYTIPLADEPYIDKTRPWNVTECSVGAPEPVGKKILTHLNTWTLYDTEDDDALRARLCWARFPGKYLNNTLKCDVGGDIAYAVAKAIGIAVEENCGDGIDNDGDGMTDCEDQDCMGIPYPNLCKIHELLEIE